MAKGQQANAITVWMIVFVALWLTSTVFLVILYTGQQELIVENKRLALAKDKVISSKEESSLELAKAARPSAEGGPTVVGLVEDARGQTANLATGSAADDVAGVKTKRDQILRTLRVEAIVTDPNAFQDLSYHAALTRLYEGYRGLHEKWKTTQDNLVRLESEASAVSESAEALKAEYAKKMQDLQDQFAEIEADRNRYRKERDEAVTQMEKEFEQGRALNTDTLTKERQERQACETKLSEARERFSTLRQKVGGLMIGPEELSTARQPDGRILMACPGDEVVYINLGRKNALTLGLQFAVYSAATGIPADGRSKAQVEVVSISEASAECRIVSVSPTDVILEGDLIANPVYDPNRPLSFVVIGHFDLDRDGTPERDGAKAVRALVKDWGGTVSDDLTPLTDFVVIGAAPPKPRAQADLPADQAEQQRARQRVWDDYTKTLENAKSLSVPVLTQDVFLNFLGYRERLSRR